MERTSGGYAFLKYSRPKFNLLTKRMFANYSTLFLRFMLFLPNIKHCHGETFWKLLTLSRRTETKVPNFFSFAEKFGGYSLTHFGHIFLLRFFFEKLDQMCFWFFVPGKVYPSLNHSISEGEKKQHRKKKHFHSLTRKTNTRCKF